MPLHDIPNSQIISNGYPISKPQELLILPSRYKIRTRVHIRSIPNSLLETSNIVGCDAFRECEDLGYTFWDGDFVDTEVGIGGNDGSSGEVDSLSGEVSSETTLFAFEALDEASDWFLAGLGGDTWEFGVDVHCHGELEEFPLFL
jgi:hypothetical protein